MPTYVPTMPPLDGKDLRNMGEWVHRELRAIGAAVADPADAIHYMTPYVADGSLSDGISANWKIANARIIRCSTSNTITVTGFSYKIPKRTFTIANVGTGVISFKNDATESSASFRLSCPSPYNLSSGAMVTWWYDPSTTRHRPVSWSGCCPSSGGGGSISDGDKGDINVSGGGSTWTIDNDVVTYAKIQNVSATSRIIGRVTAGAGDMEELTSTQAKSLLAISSSDVSGLSAIATSGSAVDLVSGTVPTARMPAFTGDVTSSAGTVALTVSNNSVTYAKIQDVSASSRIMGRATAGSGDMEELTAAQAKNILSISSSDVSGLASIATSGSANDISSGTVPDARMPAHTGDVTSTAGSVALTIANDAVTYAKMQNVSATSRFLGRITAGAGDTEELSGAQATTLLDLFTSLLKGLVPASGGGTANFLRADGTWAAPSGGGGGVSATTIEVNLGSAAVTRGKFTITDASISATSKLMVWQAPGPYTGKGTRQDEDEMQSVIPQIVRPSSGSALVIWSTGLNALSNAGKLPRAGGGGSVVGDPSSGLGVNLVFGKIRGNVKFSYVVFS